MQETLIASIQKLFLSPGKIRSENKKRVILIANYELIVKQKKKLRYNTNLSKINDLKKISNDTNLKILNIPLKFSDCFKISKVNTSKYVKRSLNLAHELCKQKKIKGFINCPMIKI